MPIDKNKLAAFKDTRAANQACLKSIGLAALQVAKPACPVKTGNLRRSHRIEFDADNVTIGVTADYGGHVHNGTSKRKAQPWLKDSIEANRDSIMALGVKSWQDNIGL